MDIKSFQRALSQIAETRGISPEVIMGTIEAALATAYKKDYGQKGQKIKAQFIPTQKNKPSESFLPNCGFKKNGEYWIYDLGIPFESPKYVQVNVE